MYNTTEQTRPNFKQTTNVNNKVNKINYSGRVYPVSSKEKKSHIIIVYCIMVYK